MPSASWPTRPLGWLVLVISSLVGLFASVWAMRAIESVVR